MGTERDVENDIRSSLETMLATPIADRKPSPKAQKA
jgi:hypothetical protein